MNHQKINTQDQNNNTITGGYMNTLCKEKPLMVIQTKCGLGKYKFTRIGESKGDLFIEFELIHDDDFQDCEKISHFLGEFCYLSPKQYLYAYKFFASA